MQKNVLVIIPFVHSLIWCWIFVMLAASPSHAFYHSDEQSGGPIFQKERCYGAWDKGERAFALYDNLNCPLDKLSQGSVICPRSDKFVPADVFMCNIPLRIAIRQPMSVENSLADLLYGNLKIKKLIEEQKAQQKKAREVLSGLRVPFVDFQMSFLEQTRTQQGVEPQMRSSDLRAPESLHSLRTRVRSAESGPLYLRSRRLTRESLGFSIQPIYQSRHESSVQDQSSLPRDTEDSRAEPPRRTKAQLAYEDRSSLPLVLRVPLKVVQYLFSHKIEALVYAGLLFLVFTMLSSMRSRGDS